MKRSMLAELGMRPRMIPSTKFVIFDIINLLVSTIYVALLTTLVGLVVQILEGGMFGSNKILRILSAVYFGVGVSYTGSVSNSSSASQQGIL